MMRLRLRADSADISITFHNAVNDLICELSTIEVDEHFYVALGHMLYNHKISECQKSLH